MTPTITGPSPSAIVAGVNASALEVQAHEFTDPAGPTTDADHFAEVAAAGGRVAVWSPDLTTCRGSAALRAAGGTRLELATPIAAEPGDAVLLDDRDTQPAAVAARFTFLA